MCALLCSTAEYCTSAGMYIYEFEYVSLVPSLSAPVFTCTSLVIFCTMSNTKTGAERLGTRLSLKNIQCQGFIWGGGGVRPPPPPPPWEFQPFQNSILLTVRPPPRMSADMLLPPLGDFSNEPLSVCHHYNLAHPFSQC